MLFSRRGRDFSLVRMEFNMLLWGSDFDLTEGDLESDQALRRQLHEAKKALGQGSTQQARTYLREMLVRETEKLGWLERLFTLYRPLPRRHIDIREVIHEGSSSRAIRLNCVRIRQLLQTL